MKVNYFGYYFQNKSNDKKVLFDFRDFLKAYSRFESIGFKNNFTHQDEHLYLLHQTDDVFLFVITRSQEIIKKINTNDLSIGEVKSLLDEDEQLGFASYIILQESFFGFGSTLLAPKFDVFGNYINSLLEALGITDWKFVQQPLLHQATKAEALAMPFIGRTTIALDKENNFAQDILASISANTEDTVELEGIEIVIKPIKRQNVKKTVKKLLNAIPEKGIDKMIVKARNESLSTMTELYVVGQGAISDNISKVDESKIAGNLKEKLSKNSILSTKITEYTSNEELEKKVIDSILRYSNDSTWTSLLSNLQSSDLAEQ